MVGVVSTILGCGVGHNDRGWGEIACFRGFCLFNSCFLRFAPWVTPTRMLAVLKHTRTEVCSKTAEDTKMLVFYLKGKSEESSKEGKGVKDSSINDESQSIERGKHL